MPSLGKKQRLEACMKESCLSGACRSPHLWFPNHCSHHHITQLYSISVVFKNGKRRKTILAVIRCGDASCFENRINLGTHFSPVIEAPLLNRVGAERTRCDLAYSHSKGGPGVVLAPDNILYKIIS